MTLAVLMGIPASLWADAFNQKVILVGDKGAALGGAYAGWADDATATYYNPAGLTLLKQAKLNVSAQIAQFQQQEIRISENTFIPYQSFNFSPTITSFSQKVGRWAFGFSIVTPQNDLFRGEQDLESDYRSTASDEVCSGVEGDTPCVTRLNLRYSDVAATNLIGPSLAYQWSDRMSVGFTLYGIYSTQLEKTTYGGWDAIYLDLEHEDAARFQQIDLIRNVDQTG
jgi:long-subunit fatty acid transport protein